MTTSEQLQPIRRRNRTLKLTAKQTEFLRALYRLTVSQGHEPTYRELTQETGMQMATVQTMIHRMRQRDYIEPSTGLWRALRLTPKGRKAIL